MKKILKEPLLMMSGVFAMIAIISGILLTYHLNSTFSGGDEFRNSFLEEEEFEYSLRMNATHLQEEIFNELLTAHENYRISNTSRNKEAYATAIVKNFIADFYTWSNKSDRTDVGGLQFIAPKIQTEFKSYAIDNFYLYLNQFIEIHGSENLLEVSNISINEILLDEQLQIGTEVDEETGDEIGPIMENVIKVNASWEYVFSNLEEHDQFQRRATFILTEENERIVIRAIEENKAYLDENSFYIDGD